MPMLLFSNHLFDLVGSCWVLVIHPLLTSTCLSHLPNHNSRFILSETTSVQFSPPTEKFTSDIKMLNSFICGTFHPEEGEDDEPYWTNFPRSPGKSRRHRLLRRSSNSYVGKESKNPYANRGLDKFSALVADLEEKRKEIYLQSGSRDIAFVRFVTSSSDEFVPVVVKSKDLHHQSKEKKAAELSDARKKTASATRDPETMVESPEEVKAVDEPKVELNEEAKRKSFSWRRPSCYVPLAMITILLLLALFGRSFAIVCASIGWYMVPALRGRGSTVVKKKKKKMDTSGKRAGERKNIARIRGASSPPKSNNSEENGRTHQDGHCTSW
ncbi:uncharacterized protein LOC115685606 [Syzygium oleosum]|uniref:uncharacterized protein LOC115685606 n=1 Tax=Syzygium oleosum TaxID=219896 RepID=UPI0011D24678|nr:uncharacterized protein LOC115685606 [Syzygium oleosum]